MPTALLLTGTGLHGCDVAMFEVEQSE